MSSLCPFCLFFHGAADGFKVFVDICNYEGYCEQASSPNTVAIVLAVVASICLVACCLMAAAFFCVSKSNTRTVTDHRTVLNHAPAAAGAARSTLSHSAAATQEGSSSYSDDVSDGPPLPAFSARGSSFSDEKPPPCTRSCVVGDHLAFVCLSVLLKPCCLNALTTADSRIRHRGGDDEPGADRGATGRPGGG